jgi:hypothetical protein
MTAPQDIRLFQIAKKFAAVPAGLPGVQLRKLVCDDKEETCKLLILGDDYADIRGRIQEAADEKALSISVRARGKSLEIGTAKTQDAASALMHVACRLPFAGEDVQDFFLFYSTHIESAEGRLFSGSDFAEALTWRVRTIDAAPQVGRIVLELLCSAPIDDERLFESAMPLLHRYDMGLLKLSEENL